MPLGDEGEVLYAYWGCEFNAIERRKRSDEALRKKKDERKHAARKRKHDKQNAAAVKIQSLVRGAQARVYVSVAVAPETQIIDSHNTNGTEKDVKIEETRMDKEVLTTSTSSISVYVSQHGNMFDRAYTTNTSIPNTNTTTFNHQIVQVAATRLQASYRGHLVRKNSVSPCEENLRSSSFTSAEVKRVDLAELRGSFMKDCKDNEPSNTAAVWPTAMTLDSPIDVSNDTTEELVQKGFVRVFIMTWNLQAQKPPSDLSSLLRPGSCHVYAIGTEECVQTIAKSVIFQSKKEWEDQIRSALPGYVMLRSHALTAMHNMVFVHSCVYPLVSNLQSDAIGTGIGNQLGNKDSGEEKRVQKAISEGFDRVFWCGDLNYRIDGTRRMIDDLLNRNFHNVLLANDQLSKERKAGRVFDHFEEGPLNFRPTYKFDKGCDVYDTSAKQRIPSWTDRILYSTLTPNAIRLLEYHSHMAIKTSDHRPVTAIFDVDFSHHDQSVRGSAVSNQTKSETEANVIDK
ncbi:hypothetical protein THRCLA_01335, partial [Thraustotheca clavata]